MKRLWGPFLSDAVVVLGLGSAVNVLNYLFVFLAARGLSTEGFGTCSALLACVSISVVIGNALQLRVTQTVAEGRANPLRCYITAVSRRLLFVGLGFGTVLVLLAEPLGNALNATAREIIITGSSIIGVLFFSFANGLTGGLRWLKAQAGVGFIATVIKVTLLVSLLHFGWGSIAVLGAYAVGVWLVLPVSLLLVFRWSVSLQSPVEPESPRTADGAAVFVAYLLITLPFMLDQILVQALAQPLSGAYSALATLGKLVFYGCAPVIGVVFPYLVGCRLDRRLFRRYAFLGGSLTLGGALIIAALLGGQSEFFVELFFSREYFAVTSLVPRASLAVVLYVAAYFVTMVLIARGDRGVVVPLGVGVVIQVTMFIDRRDSLEALAVNQLWSYGVLLACLLVYWGGVGTLLRHGTERLETVGEPPSRQLV